jgi:hypothetical protein
VKKPQNLHQWEIQHLSELAKLTSKPKLLMHSCCAVCNAWPLEYLYPYFEITLYYNNSNIAPLEEYELRLNELIHYVDHFNAAHATAITIAQEPYDYDTLQINLPWKNVLTTAKGLCAVGCVMPCASIKP